MLVSVAEKVLRTIVKGKGVEVGGGKERMQPAVLQYVHSVSHRLKKVGGKHKVPVVFTAPVKLGGPCKVLQLRKNGASKAKCKLRHVRKFVNCAQGVVYKIPLSCGRFYIARSGRCINERLCEHKYACQQVSTAGNLAAHRARCKCEVTFEKNTILFRAKDKMWCEIYEAFSIC